MDLLTRSPRNRVTLKRSVGIDASTIIDQSLKVLIVYPGRVAVFSTDSGEISSAYKGLSLIDAIHIFMARELGCQTFYTFDSGFRALKNERLLDPLEIKIL